MVDDAHLWLFRHGQAADKSPTNTYEEDYIRPLTNKGVRQSLNAGRLITNLDGKQHAIYCSPRIRTVQSAVLIASQLPGSPTAKREKQLLEMTPHDAKALLKDGKSVVIVGHGPDVDEAIEHFTGRQAHTYRGTLARIHIQNGQGQLEQLLSAKDVAALV